MSQEELGEILQVKKSSISNWETNKATPSFEILTKIADYFGVTTDYLLGFNQNDYDRMKRLESALKEAGITDLEKAMQIVEILKDTNK